MSCTLTDTQIFTLAIAMVSSTGLLFLCFCVDKIYNMLRKKSKPTSNIDEILDDIGVH